MSVEIWLKIVVIKNSDENYHNITDHKNYHNIIDISLFYYEN